MIKKQLIRWNRWQEVSTNRRIFSGMLVVAFLFAFLLLSFAINVLTGLFSSAIMSTYIRTRDNKGQESADKLLSSLIVVGILLLFVSAVVLEVFGSSVLALLGAGFNEQTLAFIDSLFLLLIS